MHSFNVLTLLAVFSIGYINSGKYLILLLYLVEPIAVSFLIFYWSHEIKCSLFSNKLVGTYLR